MTPIALTIAGSDPSGAPVFKPISKRSTSAAFTG